MGRAVSARWSAALLLSLALQSPSPTHAQGRAIDLERFRPALGQGAFLSIPETRSPGPWGVDTAIYATYASDLLTVERESSGERSSVVPHRVGAVLAAQLGLLDRAALLLHVPVIAYQETDVRGVGGPEASPVAARDPYLAARVRLLGAARADPRHAPSEGEGLAAQIGITLPLGPTDAYAGEGAPQLDAALLADVHAAGVAIGGRIGVRHRFAEPSVLGSSWGNELTFGVGVSTPIVFIDGAFAVVENRVATALDERAFQGESTSVETDIGLRIRVRDVTVTAFGGFGIGGALGTPALRLGLGVELSPRSHDRDGDGVDDDSDLCPTRLEDPDGHRDGDGCPDLDHDGDLIPDERDRCPNDEAEFGRDGDEDGCTDTLADPRVSESGN